MFIKNNPHGHIALLEAEVFVEKPAKALHFVNVLSVLRIRETPLTGLFQKFDDVNGIQVYRRRKSITLKRRVSCLKV